MKKKQKRKNLQIKKRFSRVSRHSGKRSDSRIDLSLGVLTKGNPGQSRMTINLDTFKNILLFLFLFFLSTQFGKHFFFPFSYISGVRVDYLAPTIYLTDILVFILVTLNFAKVRDFFRNKKIFLLLLLLLPSVIVAPMWQVGLFRYIKVIEFLMIFAVFFKYKVSDRIFASALACSAFFQILLMVAQLSLKRTVGGIFYFFGERLITLDTPAVAKASISGVEFLRGYGTFSHPNSAAGFYLLLYTFVLFSKRFAKLPLYKNVFLTASTLIIFITFSKTAMSLYFLINFWYLFKNRYRSKPCWPCTLSKFATLALLALIVGVAQTDPSTLSKRIDLANQALSLIFSNILTGVGLGNYLIAANQVATNSLFTIPQPVHNIFLLFTAETGILVSLFIYGCLILAVWGRRKNEALLACVIIVFFTGMADHYWLTLQQNFLVLAVAFAALIGSSKRSAPVR